MNIRIKNSSNDPIYLQIKNQIRDAIINGEFEAEELLPSIRVLAKELRVSVITTKRAYDELEREGYIHSVQGKGSFVAAQNKELMREKMLKKIEASLLDALRYAKLAEISKEELVQILDILED
ncbi:MAG: GntR family transcriptional regulator [Christensenellaceae bacterium]|nr:GntR family transcriptional regulator [Christensenellaceae bacterium]